MAAANLSLPESQFSDGCRSSTGTAPRRMRTVPSVSSMWSMMSREIAAGHWA